MNRSCDTCEYLKCDLCRRFPKWEYKPEGFRYPCGEYKQAPSEEEIAAEVMHKILNICMKRILFGV